MWLHILYKPCVTIIVMLFKCYTLFNVALRKACNTNKLGSDVQHKKAGKGVWMRPGILS